MRYAIQLGYRDDFEAALKNAKNAGFKYVAIGFGTSIESNFSDQRKFFICRILPLSQSTRNAKSNQMIE